MALRWLVLLLLLRRLLYSRISPASRVRRMPRREEKRGREGGGALVVRKGQMPWWERPLPGGLKRRHTRCSRMMNEGKIMVWGSPTDPVTDNHRVVEEVYWEGEEAAMVSKNGGKMGKMWKMNCYPLLNRVQRIL